MCIVEQIWYGEEAKVYLYEWTLVIAKEKVK